jgi:hypothetical protein
MKSAMLFLLISILAPAAVAQTTPDDKIIVPGVRIGKWTLQMTLDGLAKMNGPATVEKVVYTDYRSATFSFYSWSSLDFGVGTYEPGKVGWFAVGFSYTVLPWRTQEGIGFQNHREDVLKIYGKPSAETAPDLGLKNLIYDVIGINFQVYDTGGDIKEIRIFRPGAAKRIWKL